MVAYNHEAEDLIDRTKDHVTLYQSGDLHCKKCGKNMGKQTKFVQTHFELTHGYTFGGGQDESAYGATQASKGANGGKGFHVLVQAFKNRFL